MATSFRQCQQAHSVILAGRSRYLEYVIYCTIISGEVLLGPKIAVVDTGCANFHSVFKALERVGAEPHLADSPLSLDNAQGIVLPGVGHARVAMRALEEHAIIAPLRNMVANNVPLLGICLGMQILFERSEESTNACLGLVPGTCVKITGNVKVPHIGWNDVALGPVASTHPVFADVKEGETFYFVHSFHCVPTNSHDVALVVDYAGAQCAAMAVGNVVGTQFHPEKSGENGLRLYRNFVGWVARN